MSRSTCEYDRTSSWYDKERAPPTNKQQNARNRSSGWSKRSTRGNPAEYEGRYNLWDEGKSHDSAKDTEGEAIEGRDKSQGCDGERDVEGVAQAPKASDSALADETDEETIRSKLVGTAATPQQPKGKSKRNTPKNAEAALDTMAEEYVRSSRRP